MDAWIVLLHAPVAATTYKFSVAAKHGGSDRNAPFIETEAGFFKRHCQHPLV
jgi:hypothetical protein